MICRQIGVAPETPEATAFILELSLLPTHTPTTACELPPMAQLSRRSFVVPVLTAICCPGTLSRELAPKTGVLATLSDKMSAIMKASSGDKIDRPF